MLESIRSALYKKSLHRVLATQKRGRQAHNLNSAKKIGILFDATTEKTRHEVMEYAKQLVEKGKSVRLFGYFKTKQPPEGHAFNFFFQKETTWTGVPKSEKATAFAGEKFDLLIYLDPEECPPLEWLAAASQAAMKVGYATSRPNDFDLLLETPGDKGLPFFVEQLHLYLDKIVLTKMNPHERFRGTGVALVTPFKNNGAIDWEDLEKIIEHVIAGGVEFLVSLGTTGESVTLSDEEQRQVLDFTIKVNRGRMPVVAGVFGGNNTAAMAEKIKNFNFEGIDALLSSNPAYSKPGQEGIFQHYMELAEVSPRPIIIYNVPSRTASNMNAETTLRLANASDKFLGIKEASDDIYQVMKIIKGKPKNFLVLSGDDFITLPLIAAGGDGVISVIANTTPRPFTDMVRAALRQDMPTAQQLNLKLLELYKLLFIEGNPVGVKAALELQGLCGRGVRLPLVPMTEQGVHLVMAELEKVLG